MPEDKDHDALKRLEGLKRLGAVLREKLEEADRADAPLLAEVDEEFQRTFGQGDPKK